jgi:hypothetical protein
LGTVIVETGGHTLSVASLDEVVVPDHRSLVRVLFATHRRVAVRNGPEFCTCGDVWPCRSEELAARILDDPL